MYKVNFNKVQKELKKLPDYIVVKLLAWAKDVEKYGLIEIRKVPGYHDEPLKGHRKGQRSIRLSKSYRAIYTLDSLQAVRIVIIEEVNKHEY
jgi:proteic killer suppression protein